MEYSRSVIDRATEWVNVNYPLADGAYWDKLFEDAALEILAIDAWNDSKEKVCHE